MKSKLPCPKVPAKMSPEEEYRRFIARQESVNFVVDIVIGIVYGIATAALILGVCALCNAKAKQNAAEREADAAHADRVAFAGGVL